MNCFNHENVPAVGVCQACGKGLCRNCASETAKGLICAAPCTASREPDPTVGLLQRLSEEIEVEATEAQYNSVFYGMLLGMLTIILAPIGCLIIADSTTDVGPLLVTGAALFIALSAVVLVASSKLRSSQARSLRNAVATLTSDDAKETAPGQHATDSPEDEDRTQP